MQISEENHDAVLVISASGRIDSNTAGDLEAVLPARVESNPAVVMDLAQVAYVSSAGLRVLLRGAKISKSTGNTLVLCGLDPSVQEVFDISGFTSIFTITPDIGSALGAAS